MRPIIQNFSQLTAIKTEQALEVELVIRRHGRSVDQIMINHQRILREHAIVLVDLFSPVRLEIELFDFDEGVSGIEIQKFSINKHEVLPQYQHLASRPTNYIDTIGKWTLEIPAPFYAWYHKTTGQGWIA
jgi:hypothetical protein